MKRIFIFALIIIGLAAISYANRNNLPSIFNNEKELTAEEEIELQEAAKKERMNEIYNSPEFQAEAWEEVERRYYKEQLDEATQNLEELNQTVSFNVKTKKVKALSGYLAKKNDALVPYAEQILELDRWADVLAIAGHETTFCTRGVGSSRNNCGAIRSTARGGEFKYYASPYDALEDISYLLNKPHFKGKSIAQMNGSYCVNEAAGGGPCPNWTENIMKTVNEVKVAVLVNI